jgi:hypothetical protein
VRDAAPTERLLEHAAPLAESLLWRLNADYYEGVGMDAWSRSVVPSFISTNRFVAASYARMIAAYASDWRARRPRGEDPSTRALHVIELGAGSGRLAYACLGHLEALREAGALGDLSVRYVMTDLSARNVEIWRRHPRLRPLARAGLLDFARYDARQGEAIELLESGQRLDLRGGDGPTAVIANYLLDSLPQDAFRIEDGRLERLHLSLYDPRPEEDVTQRVSRVRVEERFEPVEGPVYGDPELDGLLADYTRELDRVCLSVPVGPLQVLDRLSRLCGGELLFLVGDKAYQHEIDLAEEDDAPHFVVHGSVSVMVNLHALGKIVTARGGCALHPPIRDEWFSAAAFALGAEPDALPATRQAFEEQLGRFGPTAFFLLYRSACANPGALSVDALLSLIELSDVDPHVFCTLHRAIGERLDDPSERTRRHLYRVLRRARQNTFDIGDGDDVALAIARLLFRLGHDRYALYYVQRSLAEQGEAARKRYLAGRCLYALGRKREALVSFERALSLEFHHGPSMGWRLRALLELGRG